MSNAPTPGWAKGKGVLHTAYGGRVRPAGPLLVLFLAGLLPLLLSSCVGRPVSPSPRSLKSGDRPALHNLNRGRVGAHRRSSDDRHD